MLSLLPVWLACASMSVVPPSVDARWFGGEDPATFKPDGPLAYEQVFLPPARIGPRDATTFVVRLYGPENLRSVEVLRNGERVFALTGMRVVLFEELDLAAPQPPYRSLSEEASSDDEDGDEPDVTAVGGTGVTPRTDVTGDGVPELVIADLEGSNHTRFERFIFQLWPSFRLLPSISTYDQDSLGLEDVDGDGAREIVTTANPMTSWTRGTYETPFESVVMRCDGQGFVPAPDLMRQPPWSDEVIAARARAIRADKDWVPERPHGPAALWHQMLASCMEGNAEQAWKLLELAWPGDAASRDAYRAEFEQELGKDRFGGAMMRLSRSSAPARTRPPEARRVFPNPSPQPGQATERVVEIRGTRSGCALPVIRVLEQGKRVAEVGGTNLAMPSNLGASAGVTGTDLDGDGHDELVFTEWGQGLIDGEWGVVSLYHVWPTFEKIDSVPWNRHRTDVFAQLDDDPSIELRVPEKLGGIWAGWRQSEPTPPTVVLKWKDGRYTPAVSLMAAPAPSPEERRALALEFRAGLDADPEAEPVPLWTEMLRLAYSGNMRSALDLFDEAWPPERDDKAKALAGFRERLMQGRFAPGVFGFEPSAKSDDGD